MSESKKKPADNNEPSWSEKAGVFLWSGPLQRKHGWYTLATYAAYKVARYGFGKVFGGNEEIIVE